MENFDPYATLGLKRTASPEQIKAAYRRAASRTHPDKPGGSEAAFTEVKQAYDLLSDPKRKLIYDETGKADDGAGPDNSLGQIFEIINGLLQEELQTCISWGREPNETDLVTQMLFHAEEKLSGFKRDKEKNAKSRAQLEDLASRFSRPGHGTSVMEVLLRQRLDHFDKIEQQNQQVSDAMGKAVEYLKGCKFQVKQKEAKKPPRRLMLGPGGWLP